MVHSSATSTVMIKISCYSLLKHIDLILDITLTPNALNVCW